MLERKLISVLFVDIVGSTARAQGADPEDVRDVLRRFQEPVRHQVELYGGVIEKFIGDAVVAVFGTPRAHGDDALRAVRCGLRILEAVVALNAEDRSLRLQVRAGVATGEAVVELSSDAARGEAIAVGEVLNTAARLQAAADPGRLVVSAETYEATRRSLRYREQPPVELKGYSEPVRLWEALPVAEASPSSAGKGAELIGRDAEFQLLRDAFERVRRSHRPELLTVLGAPGIGKSRLTSEFAAWVEANGGRSLTGRCLPYEERRAYQATVEQIRRLAGIFEADAPAVARDKIAAMLREQLSSSAADELTRPLSLLVGLGIDEPLEARQPLFLAARRLVEGLSSRLPAVLLFEDLHWADESQFELLADLVSRVTSAPALFLVAARPELEELRPQLIGQSATLLRLEPLAEQAAAALVATLLGSAPQAAAVARLIATAGGNPLFLEELAASFQQGAAVERLPVTVREAIAAHIDALPEEGRSALLDAAVIGETFWTGVLRATTRLPAEQIDSALETITRQGLVRRAERSRVSGEDEFAFKHGLIQEVAYGTLTRADRRARHAEVAEYVESSLGSGRRDLAAFLAHHWREAGEPARAIEQLLIAAEAARDAWAQEELIAHYDAAIELSGSAAEASRIRLLRGLGLVRLGDFPAAAETIDGVLPELTDRRQELEAVLARAFCAYWMEETEPALAFSERARQLADQIGEQELMAVAAMYQGLPHEYTGDLFALQERYEEARRLWVPGTRAAELATLNEYESDLWYWIGDYDRAEQLARLAYEQGGETHHAQALLRGGAWRGLCLAAEGRSEEALAWLETMYATARSLDLRWGAATLNYMSLAYRDMYQFRAGRERNQEALELVSSRGAWGMAELQGEIDICLTDLIEGEPGHVQQVFGKLWDAAINGKAWRPWLGGLRLSMIRAELARIVDEPSERAARAMELLERARRARRRKYEAQARALLGGAYLALGRAEDGLAELRLAISIADTLAGPTQRWEYRRALGVALFAHGDDDGAADAIGAAAEIVQVYAAGLSPDNRTHFLGAEPVREVMKLAGGGSAG